MDSISKIPVDTSLAATVGLTEEELRALTQQARALQRVGRIKQATDLLGILLLLDPFRAATWRRMAATQRSLGRQHEAALCQQMLSLLSGAPEPSHTSQGDLR